jgi:competence protein ComEC
MGRIAVAFLLGVCVAHASPSLPAAVWSFALAAAAVLAALCRAQLACAALLGYAWAWMNADARLANDLAAALEGKDLLLAGYIASLPDRADRDVQFTFDLAERPAGVPPRIRLTWYDAPAEPAPGELWRLAVRLKRRNGFANPGGFDYEGYLFQQGVGATGYVTSDPANVRLAGAGRRYPVLRTRAWLAARIAAAVGADPMLGVVQGLAIGDTRAMTHEQWRVFAATGTTHLMAISGLHVGMAAALFAWMGGRIVRWRGAQGRGLTALHGQVIAGAAAAVGYSLLAGLSIPTQRTLIMLCIYFAARWRRRELAVGHALGLALVGVLLVDPFAPLTPGAWLSFGAVAVILLTVAGRLSRQSAVVSFTRVQLALTIGLTPLLLALFGGVSLVAPLANAIAVPLFTLLVVPAVLAGTAAAAASVPLGSLILAAPTKLLGLAWPMLEQLSRQPTALWWVPEPTTAAFAALVLGALLLTAPGVWPMRVAGALLCAPMLLNRPQAPPPGAFELAVLDVGQGLATVVRTHRRVLVYDAGPAFRSGRDAGELAVLPYLRRRGVRRIDMLIVSHGHHDHEGGVKSLAALMPIGAMLRGPSVDSATGSVCTRGDRWTWDGVEFTVLHPSAPAAPADNDSSCVLEVKGARSSALLTGDIEADAESMLVAHGLERVDVVVAPHHGSRTSSSPAFVNALRPRIAVFSTGYRNRWGFPRPEVLERWRAVGALTLNTAESGGIELTLADGESPISFREHRRTHARYWRRRPGDAPP